MADNVTLDPGAGGAVIRTDEDGSSNHWQYVKLAYGPDNTQTIVSTTNPVPVDLRTDNLAGNLDVNIAASGVTINVQDDTSQVDDAAFTPATSRVTMTGATFDDTTPDSVDEGDGGALRMSANRNLYTQLRDAAGNERGANVNASNQLQVEIFDGGDSLTVDNATLSVTGGGTEATALRVTLANNSTGVLSVDDNGGSLTVDNAALAVTGGGTEASALRVTIANDSTGVMSVDDNGGSLTVDGTVTLGANDGVDIGDVDVTSVIPGTGATNLGKASSAIAGNSDVGVQFLGVAATTPSVVANTAAGDYLAPRVDTTGELWVKLNDNVNSDVTSVIPGTGATNLGKAEDAVHTSGDVGVMGLAVRRDADTTLAGTDGDYAPLQVNATGALKVEIFDGGDSHTIDGTVTANAGTGTFTVTDDGSFTLAANSGVDIGDVDVTSVTPGTAAGNLGKARSATAGASDTGIMPLSIRDDSLATLTDTDGEYTPTRTNNRGALWVEHDGAVSIASLPAGTNNIGDVDVLSLPALPAGTNNIGDVDVVSLPALPAGTNNIGDVDVLTLPAVAGAAAHDAAISGNPVPIAARANANEPTAVADGDATYLWADTLGRLVTVSGHPTPETPLRVNATASGETTLITAPGVGLSLYICKGSVHNSDASTEVVGLREPSGTNVWEAELAADGGGSLFDFGSDGWKLTANTALAGNLGSAGAVTFNVTEYYIAA